METKDFVVWVLDEEGWRSMYRSPESEKCHRFVGYLTDTNQLDLGTMVEISIREGLGTTTVWTNERGW